jgi:GTPase SAR1 family protein
MELEIRSWDPKTMPIDATILLVGKRNTGKTTLTRDLMWHMKDRLDLVVGMNPTEMANHNLEFFVPKSFIYHCFSEEKLAHLLEWQRRCVANNKAMKLALIMDDCMSETTGSSNGKGPKKKVMGSTDINKVFKLGRHLKMFYINAMQYIKDAPPDIRGNVDLLFVFNTTSGSEREKLWKEYFAMFKSYKDFSKVFDSCAQGFDCIVLDTRKASQNISDCIFYYRAKYLEKPFRVGRPSFWELSEKFYEDTTDYSMDPMKVLGGMHDMHSVVHNNKNTKSGNLAGASAGIIVRKQKL